MKQYGGGARMLASVLSAAAGYVDAVGFLMTGGFFVSFMSGNTTRLGVGLAERAGYAGLAAGLVGAFVGGVILGALVGRRAGARRPSAVLGLVALLLTIAAALGAAGALRLAVFPLALAMGAENTVFAQNGEVRIGLTYMTGTLVRIGKGVATALTGGDRLAWAPHALLWLGLLAGGVLGALAYDAIGVGALWAAAGAVALLALAATRLGLEADPPPATP